MRPRLGDMLGEPQLAGPLKHMLVFVAWRRQRPKEKEPPLMCRNNCASPPYLPRAGVEGDWGPGTLSIEDLSEHREQSWGHREGLMKGHRRP